MWGKDEVSTFYPPTLHDAIKVYKNPTQVYFRLIVRRRAASSGCLQSDLS